MPLKIAPSSPKAEDTASALDRARESGSIPIFKVGGVQVRIHLLLLLALLVLGVLAVMRRDGQNAFFFLGILAAITVHELGHALTAHSLGYAVRSIVLHPLLGLPPVAGIVDPRDELRIALAGPAANALAGGLLLGVAHLFRASYPLSHGGPIASFLLFDIFLLFVNLVPVLPFDGGRALRALLSYHFGASQAGRITVVTSQITAALMAVTGLVTGNLLLGMTAILICLGATRETQKERVTDRLKGVRLRDILESNVQTLTPDQTLEKVAQGFLAPWQEFFPVMHGGVVLGVLSRNAILILGKGERGRGYVAGAMRRSVAFAGPDELLTDVLERGSFSSCPPLLVTESGGRLLGIVTPSRVRRCLATGVGAASTGSAPTETPRTADKVG